MSNLTLEAGKFYRTRSNCRAFVQAISVENPASDDPFLYPVIGEVEHSDGAWCYESWTMAGSSLTNRESPEDIVGEYDE